MDLTKLPSKDILLLGVGGKTGQWYSRLLLKQGYRVIGHDKNSNCKIAEDLLSHKNFLFSCEKEELLLDRYQPAAITLTPGVPLSLPIFDLAKRQGVRIFSEVEYTAPQLQEIYPIIGITGTDGKSTTTALTASLISAAGIPALACSNFGIPFSQILCESEKFKQISVLVAELSSFQLERVAGLSLEVALYLNLAADHLDRYPSLADYCLAKWNIYHALKPHKTLIINQNLLPPYDTILAQRHPLLVPGTTKKVQIIPVNCDKKESVHYTIFNDKFYDKIKCVALANTEEFHLRGQHNLTNLLFAMEAATAFLGQGNIMKFISAAKTFKGLPHRYEILPSSDGNCYINDSKATTTQAAITSLKCTAEPIFMFLGGKGKGESYELLAKEISQRAVTCFLYGEEKDNLALALKQAGVEYFVFDNLPNAFYAARQLQQERKIPYVSYLLAPAVASWDQFSSFEERGDLFRKLVQVI